MNREIIVIYPDVIKKNKTIKIFIMIKILMKHIYSDFQSKKYKEKCWQSTPVKAGKRKYLQQF